MEVWLNGAGVVWCCVCVCGWEWLAFLGDSLELVTGSCYYHLCYHKLEHHCTVLL